MLSWYLFVFVKKYRLRDEKSSDSIFGRRVYRQEYKFFLKNARLWWNLRDNTD
jgi:hypothetical protein